jgi:hypothetical protein
LYRKGDYVAAEALLKSALKIRETAFTTNHPEVKIRSDQIIFFFREISVLLSLCKQVAQSLASLAYLETTRGQYEQAEQHYKQSIQIMQTLQLSNHPDVRSHLSSI